METIPKWRLQEITSQMKKSDCPYPAAFNSKELGHQGCEKYKGV